MLFRWIVLFVRGGGGSSGFYSYISKGEGCYGVGEVPWRDPLVRRIRCRLPFWGGGKGSHF